MASLSVVERIERYNAGREPERLARKYDTMRRSAFGFFRSTSHLFHEEWPDDAELDGTPLAWITGDLHLENFGSYKGDNQLAYFDLNDFDEATLAPCASDLARFLASVFVAARSVGVNARDSRTLGNRFLGAYRAALAEGKARWVERQTAEGLVRSLLDESRYLTRKRLLGIRTTGVGRRRRLRLGKRALPVTGAQREKVARMLKQFAAGQPDPEFFRMIDVARRVAGSASLGLERYVVLVLGRGDPDKLALLDLKQAIAPSFTSPSPSQVAWPSEAQRVVSIQRRCQAVSPALLHAVKAGQQSYVLRELQPTQVRLSIASWDQSLAQLEGLMNTLGQVVAWSHLRSSGRQGSASADEWIAFANRKDWQAGLMGFASEYGRTVEEEWKEFVAGGTVEREKG